MKNIYLSILFTAMLYFLQGCSAAKQDALHAVVEYKITADYLLLPVEDNGQEFRMIVNYPKGKEQDVIVLRLAQTKIDYWVKLDVKDYIGKNIKLEFAGIKKSSFGINNIKQSDKFEFEYDETFRPAFHFSPEYGWMNDPNGMVYLDGEYHLFFQYNPYGTRWQNMHWGHAVSTDMVSWTYLPTPLAPDTLGAIFSGSAVIDMNNTAGFGKDAMIAIYTSAGKQQTQSIAYSTDKGRTFTKYEGNPVIANPGIPDFRDPKVRWHEQTQQWIMSLATKQTVTFYGSQDLKKWNMLSTFGDGIGSHAGVWECPDLFPLTYEGVTKWVLLVSINPGGPNHGSATQYFVGDFDGKNFVADALPYPLWLDYGRDNYAGVTWSNLPKSDGRTILMGWMSNWDYANDVPTHYFRSAMTIPRELALQHNGRHLQLTNFPVKELAKLRGKQTSISDQMIQKEIVFDNILTDNKGIFEIEMTLKPNSAKVFGFSISNKEGESVRYVFDLKQNSLMVDRKKSGLTDFNHNFASVAFAPITRKESYQVKLLVDRASSEIFINGGEAVLTNIHFPASWYNILTFFTEDNAWKAESISIYELK
jgi:fructan beta-fructosidase